MSGDKTVTSNFSRKLVEAQALSIVAPEYTSLVSDIEVEYVALCAVTGLSINKIRATVGDFRPLTAGQWMQAVVGGQQPTTGAHLFFEYLKTVRRYYASVGVFPMDIQKDD